MRLEYLKPKSVVLVTFIFCCDMLRHKNYKQDETLKKCGFLYVTRVIQKVEDGSIYGTWFSVDCENHLRIGAFYRRFKEGYTPVLDFFVYELGL